MEQDRIIAENDLVYVIRDGYPVTEFHTLIIPKRHEADYFNLTSQEVDAINKMLQEQKNLLEQQDPTISGFNIGINIGEDAGQSIFHVHIHLIPRRKGDTKNPKGGVRGVIPNKQQY
jgi:diadenosine tetraphosphate (Ap4A) HIT family hydrolase